ncbi:MAG: SDR family NAD(P)-dependent oxidoreductase, partial [Gammaproteobacteria bacterium]
MSDRVAVVTGTSSGIGAALARRLLNEGWAVAGLSRREVELEHGDYQHMVLDLGNLHAVQTLAEKRLGTLMRDPRWARVALV